MMFAPTKFPPLGSSLLPPFPPRLLSPVPPPTSGLWAVWDASAGPVVVVYGLSEGLGEADPLGGSSEISPDND